MAATATPASRASEYEFHDLRLPRGISRSAARRVLSDYAEYGNWELARLRLFPDGTRKVTMRRRIIRMTSPEQALDPSARFWSH
jgi:hypothetical protein